MGKQGDLFCTVDSKGKQTILGPAESDSSISEHKLSASSKQVTPVLTKGALRAIAPLSAHPNSPPIPASGPALAPAPALVCQGWGTRADQP